MDFKELHDKLLQIATSLLREWLSDGTVTGNNWSCKSPFRNDNSAGSFKISLSTGIYKDFSTGEGGDLIQLFAKMNNLENKEAFKILSERYLGQSFEEYKKQEPKPDSDAEEFVNVTIKEEPESKVFFHFLKKKRPERIHCYKNINGEIMGYVCRFEEPPKTLGGKIEKEAWPRVPCKNVKTGEFMWKWRGFDKPRPLYGLDLIAKNPSKFILLVEGEKCADEANNLGMRDLIAIAWVGGTDGLASVDLSPLKDRSVVYWPDADDVGIKCARNIVKFLSPLAQNLDLIIPEKAWPQGYDVADAIAKGASADQIESYITRALKTKEEFLKYYDQSVGVPPDPEEVRQIEIPLDLDIYENLQPQNQEENQEPQEDFFEEAPFKFLGVNQGTYYYFSHSLGDVVGLKAKEHSKANLLQLGNLNFWKKKFPGKSDANWDATMNFLMGTCAKIMYDPDKLRGCGAWFDGGRTVVHLGEELIVDGELMHINKFTDSKFIYIRSRRSKLEFTNKIEANESKKFLDICLRLNWENPLHGILFAGWAALAPICGALKQRPHAWVTAEAGSGKTWLFDHILSPVIGDEIEHIGVGTTEAAIRGSMGNKALPILFDEAEGETIEARKRLQNILDLLKMATREGQASTKKSDSAGKVRSYQIRSMAILSSVGVNLSSQADQTRFLIFKLKKAAETQEATQKFEKFNTEVLNTLTQEFCNGLRARTISLIPTIRENIKIIEKAIVKVIPNSRASKNLATILSGVYCLASDGVLTDALADEWVNKLDWSEFKIKESEKDQNKLCEYILQTHINAMTTLQGAGSRMPIEEVIMYAFTNTFDFDGTESHPITPERAQSSLLRYGIKIYIEKSEKFVCFTKDQNLEKALSDSPFSKNYMQFLSRIDGAKTGIVQMQMKRRECIIVPLSSLLGIKEGEVVVNTNSKNKNVDEFDIFA